MPSRFPRVSPDVIAEVVGRLKNLAGDLRVGKSAGITRLTVLKRLCQDPRAASRFGLYLASRSAKQAKGKYQPHVKNALRQLRHHIAKPTSPARESLWQALAALEESQDERQRVKWTVVRTIHSRPALTMEYALRAVARPWESSFWGYRLAAFYAERYDPRYGTGLIPASRPALEDIIRFWSRYGRSEHPGSLRSRRRARPRPSA